VVAALARLIAATIVRPTMRHYCNRGCRALVPRQQCIQLVASGMAGDDPLQHVEELGHRVDAVELAGLDQRFCDCLMPSSSIRAEAIAPGF
jgi:hypothetical protein